MAICAEETTVSLHHALPVPGDGPAVATGVTSKVIDDPSSARATTYAVAAAAAIAVPLRSHGIQGSTKPQRSQQELRASHVSQYA